MVTQKREVSFVSFKPVIWGICALASAVMLSSCGAGDDSKTGAQEKTAAKKAEFEELSVANDDGATPMAERVAVLGLLNKRNNQIRDLTMKPGDKVRVGNVIVKLDACERTAPWENANDTGAFVQLFVQRKTKADEEGKWYKVFSGWLFKKSPSRNVVEHPIYDVWVKSCAMTYPGEILPEQPATNDGGNANPSNTASAEEGEAAQGEDESAAPAEDNAVTAENAAGNEGP